MVRPSRTARPVASVRRSGRVEREEFSFYFPITTGIIISIVLSLVLALVDWIFRK